MDCSSGELDADIAYPVLSLPHPSTTMDMDKIFDSFDAETVSLTHAMENSINHAF